MEVFDLSDKTERVLLVGVQENDGDDTEESLQELAELAKTAGAEVVGTVIQKRERIHPGTYVGKGKIDEIRTLLNALDATGIICDDELSPVQMNHLQQELESKIMDRTLLILDIFASRAVTKRRKDSGRTCPASLPCGASGRTWKFPFKTWRRNWNKRTRREKTGNGPSSD